MAKIEIKRLDSVTANDTTATKTINDNFKILQDAIDNSISRTGDVPNYMEADLDLNHNKLINLAEPTEDRDAVTLKYFRDVVGDAKIYEERAAGHAARAEKAASTASIYAQQTSAIKDSVMQSVVAANDSAIRAETAAIQANDSAFQANEAVNRVLEKAPLVFNDRWVSSADWFEDYLLSPDYLYSTYIPLEGVRETLVQLVTFPTDIAISGVLAPVAITVDGGLYLYAKEAIRDFNIPSIVCFPSSQQQPSLPEIPGVGAFEIDYDAVTVVNDYGNLSVVQNAEGSYTVIRGFSGFAEGFWFNTAPAFGLDHSYSYQFKFRVGVQDIENLKGTVALGNFQESETNAVIFDVVDGNLAIELRGSTGTIFRTILDSTQIDNRWVTVEVALNSEGKWQIFTDAAVVENLDMAETAEQITFPLNYYVLFANGFDRAPSSLEVDLQEVGFKQYGGWAYRAVKEIY